jgi:hypothetical protein
MVLTVENELRHQINICCDWQLSLCLVFALQEECVYYSHYVNQSYQQR